MKIKIVKKIIAKIVFWLAFTVGFMFLPIIISALLYKAINFPVCIDAYRSEFLFIAVTLVATSFNDLLSITEKGGRGLTISLLCTFLVFLLIMCVVFYVVVNMCAALNVDINQSFVDLATVSVLIAGFLISTACQIFLAMIEGDAP